MTPLKLGTRGSALARWQATYVQNLLAGEGIASELVIIRTEGDRRQSIPIVSLGAQGVFTKELQRALIEERIDLAVHSMKDLPLDVIPELTLAAVPERGDCRDAFVSNRFESLEDLPLRARIGTGSLRRKAQLLSSELDSLCIEEVRGNIETRLRKLDERQYDALVLAAVGLSRLGLSDRIRTVLDPELFLPAVGQGAIAIEARRDRDDVLAILARIDDRKSHLAVLAERSLLRTLEGGCIAPIGAFTRWQENHLLLKGRVVEPDGSKKWDSFELAVIEKSGKEKEFAEQLGIHVAQLLRREGAEETLARIRSTRG